MFAHPTGGQLLYNVFFYYYMRLLLILQLILHETITDIYKSDNYWDQLTSMLIELCPDFNPHKYSWVREKTTFTQL